MAAYISEMSGIMDHIPQICLVILLCFSQLKCVCVHILGIKNNIIEQIENNKDHIWE